MINKDKGFDIMLNMCPHWISCASIASETSGAFAAIWNQNKCSFKDYKLDVGIISSDIVRG